MEALTHRLCNVCQVEKPVAQLVPSAAYRGGYMPLCNNCRAKYYRDRRAASPKARQAFRDAVRRSRLLTDYGIDEAIYEQLVEQQGGKCGLCGSTETGRPNYPKWNIDHDHSTKRVRGLLCHSCNTALGKLETLIEKVGLAAILEYLHSDIDYRSPTIRALPKGNRRLSSEDVPI